MDRDDIRWQQRFANYNKALAQLKKFVDKGNLSELEEQGVIQAFEYTYELGWNVIRDYLREQGNRNIYGSRDAIREAFALELIVDGDGWMDMLKDRNLTVHTYNEDTARTIAENIVNRYFALFKALEETMQHLADSQGGLNE
ncbi:nucleotidyltransferase substrate-binding protein, HI0074 family [Geotalea daltonii FRC-32]|uniref:Nucleotidyltransferase substrate-binding protein, HI0074 family n=1 Tax=Geotalea daltonii (strain DSM 22248 / JCM 15807 / FRC-32) TaxID=316067 RepID=B9M4V0_GEODF|nr:nucleotidyltransferase substrate binding protein [Geotalea daltonii]ACM21634.1 nucleotidyltransferase substrate-binding protein, HI0074 family [Geotalea daltonii FRC-32]